MSSPARSPLQLPAALRTTALTVAALLAAALGSRTLRAQSEIEEAATNGSNRIIVIETKATIDSTPDLLFFKDGAVREAWNLKLSGDLLSYDGRGVDETLVPEKAVRQQLLRIQFGRSLADLRADEERERARAAPPIVASAERQPVKQREILAGKFYARQGRFTRWTFTFVSQVNKYYQHAQNATEYGTFEVTSHFRQHVPDGARHANKVTARGKYFLYAPGVFGNTDWVLNLTEVSYSENDIAPNQSVFTERLKDEVFILKLSKDEAVFHLEWANQAGWQWTSPTQQTFYRANAERSRLGSARSSASDDEPRRIVERHTRRGAERE